MELFDTIEKIKGIGPKKLLALKRLKIENIYDLITYYPRTYEDNSTLKKIADLTVNEHCNLVAEIVNIKEKTSQRGLKILTLVLKDETGVIEATFFNQVYLKNKFKLGNKIFVYGKISFAYSGYGILSINVARFEINFEENTRKFNPIYTLPEIIKPKEFRKILDFALNSIEDNLDIFPQNIIDSEGFYTKKNALLKIHYPNSKIDLEKAKETLVFEELFMIQAGLLAKKEDASEYALGIAFDKPPQISKSLYEKLPFQLTTDQKKTLHDIIKDMQSSKKMQRLIQGDVGCGKTVVALLALVFAVDNGYQGALMVPTEVLALQHYDNFKDLLKDTNLHIELLTSSKKGKERLTSLDNIKRGKANIIIGTHALIQEAVEYFNLGLVITDEQHRFGIRQRAKLEEKAKNKNPDCLIMTATPIPRTMTLTVYGDIDVSSIKSMPPGRKPISTYLRDTSKRDLIYDFLRNEIKKGRQGYVVCPLIEESENINTASAEEIFEELKNNQLRDINIALLHGKLKSYEKEELLFKFAKGEIDVLVSTTVIEVGVNVPNANMMVIEGAERFGLAQLHQLRGRVGRGEYKSYCVLINRGKSESSKFRLKLMEQITDGFILAEEDLKMRGPGQFFGNMQHGLPDLKIADVLKDVKFLLKARDYAVEYVKNTPNLTRLNFLLKLQYKNQFLNMADN